MKNLKKPEKEIDQNDPKPRSRALKPREDKESFSFKQNKKRVKNLRYYFTEEE